MQLILDMGKWLYPVGQIRFYNGIFFIYILYYGSPGHMGYVSPSLFCDHSALGEHLENTDKATTAFTTDKIAFFIE